MAPMLPPAYRSRTCGCPMNSSRWGGHVHRTDAGGLGLQVRPGAVTPSATSSHSSLTPLPVFIDVMASGISIAGPCVREQQIMMYHDVMEEPDLGPAN